MAIEYVMDIKTTLKLPDTLVKAAKYLALDEDKTLTDIIEEALTEHLKKKGKI
jgi:hypothetical protein